MRRFFVSLGLLITGVLGVAAAIAIADGPTTGTNVACATASVPDQTLTAPTHVLGYDGTGVYYPPADTLTATGTTTSACNTATYTIPTSTTTATTTATVTSTPTTSTTSTTPTTTTSTTSTTTTTPTPSSVGMVIGVYTGFGTQNLSSAPWAHMTQVEDFAEVPCNNGSSTVRTCQYPWLSGPNGDQGMTTSQVSNFVSSVHAHNLTAVMQIGGSDGHYQLWNDACATANQSAFASEIVTELQAQNLDGIDLDMEQGNGGTFTVAEWSACVQTIRAALNGVTLASGPRAGKHPLLGEDITPNCCAGQIGTAYQSEDYVNMMLYNAQCTPNGCLTSTFTNNPGDSLQSGINHMLAVGVPQKELVWAFSTDGFANLDATNCGDIGTFLPTSGLAGAMDWELNGQPRATNCLTALD